MHATQYIAPNGRQFSSETEVAQYLGLPTMAGRRLKLLDGPSTAEERVPPPSNEQPPHDAQPLVRQTSLAERRANARRHAPLQLCGPAGGACRGAAGSAAIAAAAPARIVECVRMPELRNLGQFLPRLSQLDPCATDASTLYGHGDEAPAPLPKGAKRATKRTDRGHEAEVPANKTRRGVASRRSRNPATQTMTVSPARAQPAVSASTAASAAAAISPGSDTCSPTQRAATSSAVPIHLVLTAADGTDAEADCGSGGLVFASPWRVEELSDGDEPIDDAVEMGAGHGLLRPLGVSERAQVSQYVRKAGRAVGVRAAAPAAWRRRAQALAGRAIGALQDEEGRDEMLSMLAEAEQMERAALELQSQSEEETDTDCDWDEAI